MAIQKFLIAPQDKGFETRLKSWLISDKAYENLRNAYTWRGSTRKRFGARPMNTTVDLDDQQLLTRLRVKFAVKTDGNGDFAATVIPGTQTIDTVDIWATLGKMFSVGGCTYTVWKAGAPEDTKNVDDGTAIGVNSGEYNTTTGAFTLTAGPANADVYYYPAMPVMHFGQYNQVSISDEELIAFDQQFAYNFTYGGGWQRILGTTGNNLWQGGNDKFFWTTNFRGATADVFLFFVTNNFVTATATDAMRYFDGTDWNAWGSDTTTPINAAGAGRIFIKTCRIIEPFGGRLLLFNVTETVTATSANATYVNRIRYSQQSLLGSPVADDAWRVDIVGKGGFLEIPVMEAIVSVQFLKNRCIVFCESSTWELISTGSSLAPFIVQQLDSELGVESTNSIIPFDDHILGFGNVGIHECDGMNVERVDELIPNTIFEVSNSDSGPERVAGVRDYYNELAYWSYPSINTDTGANSIFPTRVLVYNYEEESWGFNDDSITAFGLYQIKQDLTWEQIEAQWQELDIPWDDPSTQDRFRSVIAGNQQGWTFLINADWNVNALSLQITNLTYVENVITITAYNHNLTVGSFVFIQNIVDDGTIGDTLNDLVYKVASTADINTFVIVAVDQDAPTGIYSGNGTITLVSQLDILTKAYNFFYDTASSMSLNRIDLYVDKTATGKVTMDYFSSGSNLPMIGAAENAGTIMGTGVLSTSPYELVPLEENQTRFWHTVYPNFYGETIQIRIYYSNEQMLMGDPDDPTDPYIVFEDFQLNGMIFYAEPSNNLGT